VFDEGEDHLPAIKAMMVATLDCFELTVLSCLLTLDHFPERGKEWKCFLIHYLYGRLINR